MQPGVPPTLVFIMVIFGGSVFTPSLPPPHASQGNLPQYGCSKAAKPPCSLCSFPNSHGAIPLFLGSQGSPRPHSSGPRQPRASGSRVGQPQPCPVSPRVGWQRLQQRRWAGPGPRYGDGGRSRHSGPPQSELPSSQQRSGGSGYHGLDDKGWRSRCRDTKGMPTKLAPCSCWPHIHSGPSALQRELGIAPLPSSAPRSAPGRRHRTTRCCPGPAHVKGSR